ncbi:hypothetical protein A2973_00830 [Candidatus Gottesmanbacteria bacterium RIFCSPLOWO2_01_FULL_49_10]|uniref:Membrane protein 6-pyruvoyl-tetrahydropterin synthase-related domain-containing protein n=1 Tax=Candidatus Gottesmanbacteria bacterium RIFCSPLOWO2_01_FULL_49_10 TaxID=1798396 RepID=A0A1F6AWU0_9BACT|nr:MAG: hypothetical protein A2973_00830 [Candidatus Gottesmanbacteria bacterium RIFCSPLOWO2_01_FULL_49_10]
MLLIVLVSISFVPLLDLFHPGIPLGHDTPDHVARIASFYASLREGILVPRWAGNLNWGYGHPILMFLYPLPSYVASFFHALGFSFVDSTKLVFAVSYIASLLAMYLFASTAWGALPGSLAAVLYGFAPYRFVDLYVRGAIGEHVAFIFPPLIAWGLLKESWGRQSDATAGFAVGLGIAGLLLSHNAVSLMMLPFLLLYGGYLFFFEAKDRLGFFVRGWWFAVIGFFVSAFFWMPAFLEGKYTLRDIVTKGDFASRFVPWQSFIWSPWNWGGGNEFTKEIGISGLLVVGLSIVLIVHPRTDTLRKKLLLVVLAVLFGILLMMTSVSSPLWNAITILQKFQFPWRFLSVAVFILSVLGGIAVSSLPKKYTLGFVVVILFVSIVTTIPMWHAKQYSPKDEKIFDLPYPGTTDTGESSPIWSIRFMEHFPRAPAEVISGNANIAPGSRKSTHHSYVINAKTKTRIVENTLYFPGWNIDIDGSRLNSTEVQYQDPDYRGLMTFWIEPGQHSVMVSFTDTKLRTRANQVSLVGLLFFVLTWCWVRMFPKVIVGVKRRRT